MKNPATSSAVSAHARTFLKASPPNIFIGGLGHRIRLGTRLKHAGMTDSDWSLHGRSRLRGITRILLKDQIEWGCLCLRGDGSKPASRQRIDLFDWSAVNTAESPIRHWRQHACRTAILIAAQQTRPIRPYLLANSKSALNSSFALTVTFLLCLPRVACHTSSVYSPGGTSVSL